MAAEDELQDALREALPAEQADRIMKLMKRWVGEKLDYELGYHRNQVDEKLDDLRDAMRETYSPGL